MAGTILCRCGLSWSDTDAAYPAHRACNAEITYAMTGLSAPEVVALNAAIAGGALTVSIRGTTYQVWQNKVIK